MSKPLQVLIAVTCVAVLAAIAAAGWSAYNSSRDNQIAQLEAECQQWLNRDPDELDAHEQRVRMSKLEECYNWRMHGILP